MSGVDALTPFPEAPALRLPDPALLFEGRAGRLRALSAGHPASDFLLFLARLAAGQRDAVREVRPPAVAAAEGGAPLAPERVARDASWRRMLAVVLSAARGQGLPPEADGALRRLSSADPAALEALADAVLAGPVRGEDLACAPFVGAALQAYFAALAARLDPKAVPPGAERCPVCASPAIAAVVGATDRARYLSCALCGAEWKYPRLQCTLCHSEGEVTYFQVEGDEGGAKAEACSACRAYVKVFDEQKRRGAEAAADDAATLALDLLLGEDGWRRAGVNLYLDGGA